MSLPFAPIAPEHLDAVAGGASSRAATDERLLDKLTSITATIKDVAAQQATQNNDPMSQLMPIIAMRMMKRPT